MGQERIVASLNRRHGGLLGIRHRGLGSSQHLVIQKLTLGSFLSVEVRVGDGVNGRCGDPPLILIDPLIELLAVLPFKLTLVGPLNERSNLHIHPLGLVIVILHQRVLLQGCRLGGTQNGPHRDTIIQLLLQQFIHQALVARLGNG